MITVTGILTTTGPLSISTGRADEASDRPVLRDLAGRPVITGSSLAGALRSACNRRYGTTVRDQLFGPAEISPSSPARRSALRVDEARYVGDDIPPVQLRQHVAIDRERLAAAPGLKFDAQTWPRGLRFGFRLVCEETDLATVVGTLDALCSPGGGLGAGPCPVEISDLAAHRRAATDDLVRAAGLRFEQPDLPVPPGTGIKLPRPARPSATMDRTFLLELTVRTVTPLACREPLDPFSSDRDNEPFTVVQYSKDGQPLHYPAIPGTSLLGVLRQRAERAVARLGHGPSDPTRPEGVDPASPIGRTFGTAGSDTDPARAGAVLVDDLVAQGIKWDPGIDPAEQPNGLRRIRVRIDRLTHSTLGSNLFDDTLLAEGTILRGRIAVAPPDRPADEQDLALVAIGLRDLASGSVGVGGSSRSGYGTLEIIGATLIEHRVDEDGIKAVSTELTSEDGRLDWGEPWTQALANTWREFATSSPATGGDHA